MAGTFSQIYIQIVFAVKFRECMIEAAWEADLYKYITGIITQKQQKLLAINGMSDHIHIFIGMKPACCLSDLVREIKKASTTFINEHALTRKKFQWQGGFGAFSYSQSSISNVITYIQNQKEHHKTKSFRTEYKEYLKYFEIEHEDKHLFDWLGQ